MLRNSVSAYLSEFRNTVLTIPGMIEGEQVDRFCQGLKRQVSLEVMKAGVQPINEASRIALNVDSTLFGKARIKDVEMRHLNRLLWKSATSSRENFTGRETLALNVRKLVVVRMSAVRRVKIRLKLGTQLLMMNPRARDIRRKTDWSTEK